MDKLDKLLAKMSDPEAMEAARLAKMARVKPPRLYGDMAGDVTTSPERMTREIMEGIARGFSMPRPDAGNVPKGKKQRGKMKSFKYGGKVEGYERGGMAGGSCRGGGAAMRGTSFKGVK